MTRLKLFLVCALVATLVCFAHAAPKKGSSKNSKKKEADFIDAMDHDIQVVTPQNFDHNIRKFRDDKISAVMFFKPDADTKKIVDGWYNKVAKELKGMIKIAAVNCEEFPVFCKEQNIKKYPSILIFPPNPLPVIPFEAEKDITPSFDSKQLVGALSRYIPSSNIKTLDDKNIDEFLAAEPGKPKILLFSNKKGFPTIYKALSSHFKKEMKFGFVKEEEKNICSRYKVTKFPHMVAIRPNKNKPEVFGGKMEYTALYDWMNVFSETFVGGGGFSDAKGGAGSGKPEEVKPWTVQRIPEITKASHGDVCFKKGEGLCVIYLKANGRLDAAEENMLDQLRERYTSHLADRGTTFRWMWMDVGVETEYQKLFDVDTSKPTVVVFNPHKRLRFTKMDAEQAVSEQSIKNLIDRITGGDARFKMVPGQKLPEFANRSGAAAPGGSAKDEL